MQGQTVSIALAFVLCVLATGAHASSGYDPALYPAGVPEWGYYNINPMDIPIEGTEHDPVWDPSSGLSPHEARVKAGGEHPLVQTRKYAEYMLTYPNTQTPKDRLQPLFVSTRSMLRGESENTERPNRVYGQNHGFEEEDDFPGLATQYQFVFGMSLPIPFPPVASFMKIGFEVGLIARERPKTHFSGISLQGHFDIGIEFDFGIAKFGVYLHVSGGLKASNARMPLPYVNTIQTAIRYVILQKLRTLQEMCREKLVAEKKYLENQRELLSMEIIRDKLNGGKPIRDNVVYKFDVMRNGVTPLYYRKHSSKGWQWSPPSSTNQHRVSGTWMTVDDHTVDASLSLYIWQTPVKENLDIIDSLASMKMPERTAPCYHILRKHFSYNEIRTQTYFSTGRIRLRVSSSGIWRWRKVANWAWQDSCKNYVNLGRSHWCGGVTAESSERQLIDELNMCSAEDQGAAYRPPASNYRMTTRERILHCISSPIKCVIGKVVQFTNWISGGKLEAKFRQLRTDTANWIKTKGVKDELIMQAQIGIALKASATLGSTKFGGKFIAAAGFLSKVNTNDPERSTSYTYREAMLEVAAEDIPVVGDIKIRGSRRVYSQAYLRSYNLGLTTKHWIAFIDVLLKQDMGISKVLRLSPGMINRAALMSTAFANRFKTTLLHTVAKFWPSVFSRFTEKSCEANGKSSGESESSVGTLWGRLTKDWKDVLVNSITGYLRNIPAVIFLSIQRPRLGFRLEPRWTTSREPGKAIQLNMDKSNLLAYVAYKSPVSEFTKLIPKAGPVSGKFKFRFSFSAYLPFRIFFPQAKDCSGKGDQETGSGSVVVDDRSDNESDNSNNNSDNNSDNNNNNGDNGGSEDSGNGNNANGPGDERCSSVGGTCTSNALRACDNTRLTILSRHCAGPSDRKCCTSRPPPGDEPCAAVQGICHEEADETCLGPTYYSVAGKCSGSSSRRCCVRQEQFRP